MKLNPKPQSENIRFDVSANLEEKERKGGKRTLFFELAIGTKPSIVKFGISGDITLEGKDSEIEKLLEQDQETNVPKVLSFVYQHSFIAIYILATLLKTAYPPPNLLHIPKQTTKDEVLTTTVEPSAEAVIEEK
jgi:hypothetical protein